MMYADNAVLLVEDPQNLQNLFDRILNIKQQRGLEINMTNGSRKDQKPRTDIIIKNEKLEQVISCSYLGQILNEGGICEVEIKRRIRTARHKFSAIKTRLLSRNMSIKTKMSFVKCYIYPIWCRNLDCSKRSERMIKKENLCHMVFACQKNVKRSVS